MDWSGFFFAGSLLIYFSASAAYIGYLYYRSWKGFARWLTRAAFLSHTLVLLFRFVETGKLPFLTLFNSALFFSWVLVFNFLLADLLIGTRLTGLFLVPLVFLFLVFAAILPKPAGGRVPVVENALLLVHIVAAFLAYAAFAVSFVAGLMYLLQERQLRTKAFSVFYHRLPSLESLDRLGYRLIAAGLVLLTLTIVMGAFWARAAWGRIWDWDPKETWTLVTWVIYGLYLLARWHRGWIGRKAAVLSLVGFLAAMVNFFLIDTLFSRLHTF